MDFLHRIQQYILCKPIFEDVIIYEVTENFETIELY
jgi:hypothetical protein